MMALLAVLIAVNVLLLFLLFRPDQASTGQPEARDTSDGGSPAVTSWPNTRSVSSRIERPNKCQQPQCAEDTALAVDHVAVARLLGSLAKAAQAFSAGVGGVLDGGDHDGWPQGLDGRGIHVSNPVQQTEPQSWSSVSSADGEWTDHS
jgi:hypothetical protein